MGISPADGLNRTSVGLKQKTLRKTRISQKSHQSNQRGIETATGETWSHSTTQPQSNQRGIETAARSTRSAKAMRGLNRTSV